MMKTRDIAIIVAVLVIAMLLFITAGVTTCICIVKRRDICISKYNIVNDDTGKTGKHGSGSKEGSLDGAGRTKSSRIGNAGMSKPRELGDKPVAGVQPSFSGTRAENKQKVKDILIPYIGKWGETPNLKLSLRQDQDGYFTEKVGDLSRKRGTFCAMQGGYVDILKVSRSLMSDGIIVLEVEIRLCLYTLSKDSPNGYAYNESLCTYNLDKLLEDIDFDATEKRVFEDYISYWDAAALSEAAKHGSGNKAGSLDGAGRTKSSRIANAEMPKPKPREVVSDKPVGGVQPSFSGTSVENKQKLKDILIPYVGQHGKIPNLRLSLRQNKDGYFTGKIGEWFYERKKFGAIQGGYVEVLEVSYYTEGVFDVRVMISFFALSKDSPDGYAYNDALYDCKLDELLEDIDFDATEKRVFEDYISYWDAAALSEAAKHVSGNKAGSLDDAGKTEKHGGRKEDSLDGARKTDKHGGSKGGSLDGTGRTDKSSRIANAEMPKPKPREVVSDKPVGGVDMSVSISQTLESKKQELQRKVLSYIDGDNNCKMTGIKLVLKKDTNNCLIGKSKDVLWARCHIDALQGAYITPEPKREDGEFNVLLTFFLLPKDVTGCSTRREIMYTYTKDELLDCIDFEATAKEVKYIDTFSRK